MMVRLKGTATTRNLARKVVVAAVASVAGMVFAATPATTTAADFPSSDFEIGYEMSSYDGSIIWYNRSVRVTGVFRASGCRRVYARAFPSSANVDFVSSSTWCNTIGSAPLPLGTSNVIGGPTKIWVYMTDGAQKYLAGQTCYPSLRDCVTGLK